MPRIVAKVRRKQPFDVKVFRNIVDGGRSAAKYRKNQKVCSQGAPADAVFYIQEGKVKVCVISEQGKEAVVALGEGCLNGHPVCMATVVTVTVCAGQ